jgi:hypothetical protein
VEFGRLDVPLAVLAASTGYFPGFDRTQDRGFVQFNPVAAAAAARLYAMVLDPALLLP